MMYNYNEIEAVHLEITQNAQAPCPCVIEMKMAV